MKQIFFCVFLLFAKNLSAQNSNDDAFAFPSSNNSFLGKSVSGANVGVDLYTGMAQVSVPICKLTSKQLTVPVSVDYVDGRGVKVQEYASQVGLGWQLNAGGGISRVVRGFPDEQPNGYIGTGTQPAGVLSAGQRWGQIASIIGTQGESAVPGNQDASLTGVNYNPFSLTAPTADGEPDIFYVKTPYFSFQFVFNAAGTPVFSNNEGFKIIPTNFFNTFSYQTASFEVIDDQGNQYYFGSSSQSTEQSTDSLYGVPTTFISTWYLDKIVAYNSADIITLTYQAGVTNDVTYNYSWSETQNGSLQTQTTLYTGQNIVSPPKFVSTISSSLGEIDFFYALNTRLDDNKAGELTAIVLKAYNPQTGSNSTTLQTFNFNYGYFGLPSTDPNVLRLQLNSITVTGNTSATSTPLTVATFGYNTTTALPNRTWPIFDYWGYCNTTTYTGQDLITLNPYRNANASTIQADILNSVYTMQGGIWQISYEPNVYGGALVDGVRVNQITQVLPTGSTTKTYQYVYANNSASGQILTANYTQLYYIYNNTSVYFSGSPFITNDINGNFVGYSSVKETQPNGGYTIYTFSNFSDQNDLDGVGFNDQTPIQWSNTTYPFPLSIPFSDLSFKRGLPTGKTLYTINGTTASIVSQTTNIYTPINTSVTYDGYGVRGFTLSTPAGSNSCTVVYKTPIENYRLTQVLKTDNDQLNPTNSVSSTTNYTYDNLNKRLIQTISTIDSKSQTHTQTIYHAEDIANNLNNSATYQIPMIASTPESNAISTMVANNKTNVEIHKTDNRNATVTQMHNTYAISQVGLTNNVYLANTASYNSDPVNTSNSLAKQLFFGYDPTSSRLISTNPIGGTYTSSPYGYNTSLSVAKVVNAANTVTLSNQAASQTGTISIPPNTFGAQITTFVTFSAGTITIAMPPGSYLAGSVECYFSFSLTGPASGSGNLCNSSNSTYTCSVPNTKSFSNMPAGTYSLSVSAYTNTATSSVPVTFTYPGYQIINTAYTEFFYEGFEQIGNVTTGAHTGNACFSGSYTVPFVLPNSRSYLIQYWSYSSGAWVFNQLPYTGTITLSGQIDDVRIFPKDGLMTTYTYNPLVGKTSETDPSGRSVVYQYDGLNRLQTVRDQDNNILKQYDYQYQILPSTGSNSFGMTGVPGYSSSGPTTGQGTIYGPVGKLVTVTMSANGQPGYNYGLTVSIPGVAINGPTSVTNGTASFTFIMPMSGTVGWSASFVPTGGSGGGSFSIH